MLAATTDARPVPDLIARSRLGDPEALASLYASHARAMLALARRLLGNDADAEDVLHDVFVALPETLGRYRDQGALESWLKRVTARVALNRLRRGRRAREVSLDAAHGAALESTAQRSAPSRDAIDAMALGAAIDALPDTLRVVFVLREVAGYTHLEIADLLRISRGASEVRLHRAIAALRRRLVTP